MVAAVVAPACLSAASFTFVTGSGAASGAERCLSGASQDGGACNAAGAYSGLASMIQLFADSQGATLTRVDDTSEHALDDRWSRLRRFRHWTLGGQGLQLRHDSRIGDGYVHFGAAAIRIGCHGQQPFVDREEAQITKSK